MINVSKKSLIINKSSIKSALLGLSVYLLMIDSGGAFGLRNIGFILIDDPVQTMDDINIASFIEVLRNDFPEKQIILSTHETDKENYILYKFLKY